MCTPRVSAALLLVLAACSLPGPGSARPAGAGILTSGTSMGLNVAQDRWEFWSAVADLDLRRAERRAPDADHRSFVRAVRQVLDGDMEEAEGPLARLAASAGDSVLRSASHVALSAALEYQGKWGALDDLGRRPTHSPASSGRERAAIETWAVAMRLAPEPVFRFPALPVVLPFVSASTGTPIVHVRVNGIPRQFWIDTGSTVTLVASDVAAEAGVELLARDTLHLITAVGVTGARPATIRRLEIGGLVVEGQPVAIISARDLTLARGEAPGEGGVVKIDGVIGMDVIRRLNVEIDFLRRRVHLSRSLPSQRARGGERNLLWLGSPIVRVEHFDGRRPLYFGLDTGANRTYATEGLLRKLPKRYLPKQRQIVAGFGGDTTLTVPTLPDLALLIAERRFFLQEVPVHGHRRLTFLPLDGVIGNDAAEGLVMRIDMTNGVFGIGLSPSSPGGG
ncbi:MAG TPA: retropepsin-like aspartic protease [Longimicrobiaceae bacterium]|nr:retropepsin-like aspartic protease [Longimicrobiaceae bacterium]